MTDGPRRLTDDQRQEIQHTLDRLSASVCLCGSSTISQGWRPNGFYGIWCPDCDRGFALFGFYEPKVTSCP